MRGLLAAGLAVALSASACASARRDDVRRCKAAEAEMYAGGTSAAVVARACSRAFRRTGSPEALVAATRSQARDQQHEVVLIAARAVRGDIAPRIWTLAGEVEAARGNSQEARSWYERALDARRNTDPRVAANIAARIADVELQRGALDEGIRFVHQAQSLAAAAGDADLRALMTMFLAQLLLGVGDVRTANRTLASMTEQVLPSAAFYREYLAIAGEVDAAAGRTATAAASFELCVAPPPPPRDDPGTQWRCHLGRAALAAAVGGARDADARRDLELAAGYVEATDVMYGRDPDRAAEVAWLRAQLDLRDPARAAAAFTSLEQLAATALGAATRSRVCYTLGRALVARGDLQGAERWFGEAAAAIETQRDGGEHGEVRRSLPRELRAPFEALFVLRARSGDAEGALAAMEHALDRDFLDQLAASVAALHDEDTIEGAERRLRAMRWLRRRPAVRFSPATAAGTLIGFFAADDGLWRARVAAGKVQLTRVADLAALLPLVKAVRADPAAAEARELRERLLPEAALPAPEEPLVVVPDPFLEGVRFAALPRAGQYLIERNPIVLAPTFAMAVGAGAADPPAEPSGDPVVLGDPDPARRLPHAREEATAVAALLGVAPRLGPAADRAAMIAGRRARVLHVASHGSTRDDGTLLSLGDGDFGTADVLEHGVAPDLVVVASCTSAATRPDAMWTSVAAAFLASGSPSVVGATASIPDDVARDIVVELHRHAREVDAARALARALRSAIARGTPTRSWSAFAVLGRMPRAAFNDKTR